jgi:hypothetical protein
VRESEKRVLVFRGVRAVGKSTDQQNALSIKRVAAKRESKPQYARIQTVE